MKKTYQIPEIEVTLMESTELMQASTMSMYTDEVPSSSVLSRDDEMFFDED